MIVAIVDIAAIETATNELNAAWQVASEEMYKAQGAGQQQEANPNPGPSSSGSSAKDDKEVTDVDFEEVK